MITYVRLRHALVLVCLSIGSSISINSEHIPYAFIGNLVLDTEDHIQQTQAPSTPVAQKTQEQQLQEMLKELNKEKKRQLVFTLLQTKGNSKSTCTVHEPYVLHELSILKGSETSKKINLLARIDNTSTTFGTAVLAHTLAHPITDKATLAVRQEFIKHLLNDKKIFELLDAQLKTVADHETLLFNLWNPDAQLNPMLLDRVRFPSTSLFKYFNTNPRALQIARGLDLCSFGLTAITAPIIAVGAPIGYYKFSGYPGLAFGSLLSALQIIGCKLIYSDAKFRNSLVYLLHKQVRAVKTLVAACTESYYALKALQNNTQALTLFSHLEQFVKDPAALDSRLKDLMTIMQRQTFDQNPTWHSHFGNIVAAYTLLQEIKDLFIAPLEALGEIDAYMSIARLMRQHEHTNNKYVFVEFLDRDTPFVALEQVWNPLITSDTIVSEDIMLGAPEGAQNIMLTGPHGGGKSTIMKSILYSILLGQTYGIAPAEHAQQTIFDRVNTYVNIKEDLAAGQSTFMVEKNRVDAVQKSILGLQHGQKCFTIMDEVFKGTMEVEGARRLYNFAKTIAPITQNICVIATHFEKPAQLEQETGEFANYHVGLIEQADGSFIRTFKLVKGANQWWFDDAHKRERYIDWLMTQQ